MKKPPKTRRFLARNHVFHYCSRSNRWHHEGYQWIEAFWSGTEYRIWCGKPQTFTTNKLDFDEWSELP